MVKDQVLTDNYAIYNGDCMHVLPTLAEKSIDLSVYSPPFAGLYNYSSSENDFSNCESKEQFLEQYEFLVKEIARVMKPGRITAVHCQDILLHTTAHNIWDFPHEIIQLHLKYGFTYNNRITIWKEPLEVRNRTMVNSLKHKRWYAKNKEYVAQKGREWNAANPEKRKQISKNWEINNPEKTKEKNRKAQAALRERKRNAKRNQERREHEQTAQTIPAPQAKGNGRTGATAHTKRVQTTSNDARSISAASV